MIGKKVRDERRCLTLLPGELALLGLSIYYMIHLSIFKGGKNRLTFTSFFAKKFLGEAWLEFKATDFHPCHD